MYKTVLEHEIKSTVISLQVLVAFLILLQRQKWQHPGAQSSSMGTATWSYWLLKLRLASWRHARVSCCSGTEWSFGQIYSNVWLDTQSWLNSLSLSRSALLYLQSVWMLLWAEGDGIWGLEGLPCQVLQTSDTTVIGRGSGCGKIIFKADWNASLFLNGAIHNYNSSYICLVPKHTLSCFGPNT